MYTSKKTIFVGLLFTIFFYYLFHWLSLITFGTLFITIYYFLYNGYLKTSVSPLTLAQTVGMILEFSLLSKSNDNYSLVGIYLLKGNNRNARTNCSKLTRKTPQRRQLSSLLLRFHNLFYCFYCWLWISKYPVGLNIPINIVNQVPPTAVVYFHFPSLMIQFSSAIQGKIILQVRNICDH